jgi:hypothetical protein
MFHNRQINKAPAELLYKKKPGGKAVWNLVFSDSAFLHPRAPNFIITHDQTTTPPAHKKKRLSKK